MPFQPPDRPESRTLSPTFVLVGNPNTGKSTLFNALTGQRQQVANYPGVTVAKKTGQFLVDSLTWTVTDLPGTYSLSPQSPDERITADVLAGKVPGVDFSAIVCVVDASNLRRNLFLATQVLELGYPTIMALTKIDLLENRGERIDLAWLAQVLQCPVVPLDVRRNHGLAELQRALVALWEARRDNPSASRPRMTLTGAALAGTADVQDSSSAATDARYAWIDQQALPALQVARRAVGTGSAVSAGSAPTPPHASELPTRRDSAQSPAPTSRPVNTSFTDRIDTWLTHWVVGSCFFLLIMFGMFFAVFQIADPASQWIDWGRDLLDRWVMALVPAGMFRDLISEGILGGVGNFIVFLPQIFILFLFIGTLESTGYMARAAYLMDRAFSPIGLSGKSFVPLLSSFACAVPGIMATRIIDSRRDRLLTIMVAPLMSCSARLPVYVLMTSALVSNEPWLQSLVLLVMYLTGVVVALAIVLIWKRLVWREPSPTFLLELPEFQFPDWVYVIRQTLSRSGEFVVRAGTVILAVTILVWAANYFPRNDSVVATQLAEITRLEAAADGEAADGGSRSRRGSRGCFGGGRRGVRGRRLSLGRRDRARRTVGSSGPGSRGHPPGAKLFGSGRQMA
jgi:ferrous iron transport protein B